MFALLKLHEINSEALEYLTINVRRQVSQVDIVVEAGEDLIISIEDKTDTELHSGKQDGIKNWSPKSSEENLADFKNPGPGQLR